MRGTTTEIGAELIFDELANGIGMQERDRKALAIWFTGIRERVPHRGREQLERLIDLLSAHRDIGEDGIPDRRV